MRSTIPGVVVTVVTLLCQRFAFDLHAWPVTGELLASAGIGIAAGILTAFFIQLAYAPVELDKKQRDEIAQRGVEIQTLEGQFRPRQTPKQKRWHGIVTEALQKYGNARGALLHLHDVQRVLISTPRNSHQSNCSSLPDGMNLGAFSTALSQLHQCHIVRRTPKPDDGQNQSVFEYEIETNFLPAVEELLYVESNS